jgi:hypothetical protein
MTLMATSTADRLIKITINALLVVVTLAVALVAAEYATRFIMRDITSTANLQTWFGERWKNAYVTLNSQGYRDAEFPPARSEDTFRIAVVGDSFAFGLGLPVEERFADLLGKDLSASCNQAVEVLNFAKPGYNTVQEHDILRNDVLATQPDLILLQWLPNDVEEFWQGMVQPTPPLLLPQSAHKWLIKNSALYYLFNQFWQSISSDEGAFTSYQDRILAAADEPGSEKWLQQRQLLLDFLATVEQAGLQTVVVMFPMFATDPELGYRMQPVHSIPLSACEQSSTQCIDLLGRYMTIAPEGDFSVFWVNILDSHPSGAANRIAANEILRAVEWNDLTSSGDTPLACNIAPDLPQ